MRSLPKYNIVPVFEDIQAELILLLRSLTEDDWSKPTPSTEWSVKDVAAHLLDGDVRRLSLHRDEHTLPAPSEVHNYRSLVEYLNHLNQSWVEAARRLSPELLTELTEFLAPAVTTHYKTLDPEGTALFSVAWAGEEESQNWFDLAREYTEKWHHQQQIREAAGRELLVQHKWLYPLIRTLIRGVPPVYNEHASNADEQFIQIYISGVIDESWLLANQKGKWKLLTYEGENTCTRIELSDDTAWRMFSKNISEKEAVKKLNITGNQELGRLIAKTVSFMK